LKLLLLRGLGSGHLAHAFIAAASSAWIKKNGAVQAGAVFVRIAG
jgi:hypothetical protein